jgi:CHASE3 domain sensor protein
MKNMTVSMQLAIGFGSVLALLLGTLAFSVYQQYRLAELTEQQYRHPFAVSNAIARADANILRMARALQEIAQSNDDTNRLKYIAQVDALEAEVQRDLSLAKASLLGNQHDLDWLVASFKAWKPVRSKIIDLKRAGKTAEAEQVMRTENAFALGKISALKTLVYDSALNKAEVFRQNAAASRDEAMETTLWLGLVTLLVGITLWWSMLRSLRRIGSEPAAAAESTEPPFDEVGQVNRAGMPLQPMTRQNAAKPSTAAGEELEFVSF